MAVLASEDCFHLACPIATPKYLEWKTKRDREAACRHYAAIDPVDLHAVNALELWFDGPVDAELRFLRQ